MADKGGKWIISEIAHVTRLRLWVLKKKLAWDKKYIYKKNTFPTASWGNSTIEPGRVFNNHVALSLRQQKNGFSWFRKPTGYEGDS